MTGRKNLSRNQRVKIFDRCEGMCMICGIKIQAQSGEQWEIDHTIPLWLGGVDLPGNMAAVHVMCHRGKSSADAPVKAKIDRVRAKFLGVTKPSRGGFRGWRKFDGTLVRKARS